MQDNGLSKQDYEWVWVIRSVKTEPGEAVPMEKGDSLYLCMCDDGSVRFRHRNRGDSSNSELWNEATGCYDPRDNSITGSLPDKTRFRMTISRDEKHRRITCRHQRNPDQGEWDADDDMGL